MAREDLRAGPHSRHPAVPSFLEEMPEFHFKKKKKIKKLEERNTNSGCARLLRGSSIEIRPPKSHVRGERPTLSLNPTRSSISLVSGQFLTIRWLAIMMPAMAGLEGSWREFSF